jgi:site-specific DNA-methyltransferase (adenine-specific)
MSTDENDVVLDPFIGAGTTAIAAKRLGRKYIGIDIDEKYVNITQEKLENEFFESKISDIWVSFFLEELITIRDIDWDDLAKYFSIPVKVRDIDFEKIRLLSLKNPKKICKKHLEPVLFK